VCAASSVQFGDEVAGGAIMIASSPAASVGNPSREGSLRGGGEVTDMNAAMIKVEVECLGFAFAEGELSCRFTRVDEAMQLGQAEGAVALLDVAEDIAGADRGELLIISDQSYVRTAIDGELDGGVEERVSAMPASSMITSVDGPIGAAHSGSSACCNDQISFASVSVRMPTCSRRTAAAVGARARARIAVSCRRRLERSRAAAEPKAERMRSRCSTISTRAHPPRSPAWPHPPQLASPDPGLLRHPRRQQRRHRSDL
jgi:hypothetical protein